MSAAIWVVVGAAVGAPLRYLAGLAFNRRWPWGTLLVNVAGSFIFGLALSPAIGIGFCGALTTYSAFALETVELASAGRVRAAVWNVTANVALGLLAAVVGSLAA